MLARPDSDGYHAADSPRRSDFSRSRNARKAPTKNGGIIGERPPTPPPPHGNHYAMTAIAKSRINYRGARFLTSAPTLKECPPDSGTEVAFAGRSNAGKSSAINTLTGNGKLARTSKTPGRTQLLNFFDLGDDHRLVDLPGYGFAKVPLAVKEQWQRHLEHYLQARTSLRGLVLLMDIRHPLQAFDLQLLAWAQASAMPTHVLLTKSDKLKFGAAKGTLLEVRKALQNKGQVSIQLFSATNAVGLEELQARLDDWLLGEGGDTPVAQ